MGDREKWPLKRCVCVCSRLHKVGNLEHWNCDVEVCGSSKHCIGERLMYAVYKKLGGNFYPLEVHMRRRKTASAIRCSV